MADFLALLSRVGAILFVPARWHRYTRALEAENERLRHRLEAADREQHVLYNRILEAHRQPPINFDKPVERPPANVSRMPSRSQIDQKYREKARQQRDQGEASG